MWKPTGSRRPVSNRARYRVSQARWMLATCLMVSFAQGSEAEATGAPLVTTTPSARPREVATTPVPSAPTDLVEEAQPTSSAPVLAPREPEESDVVTRPAAPSEAPAAVATELAPAGSTEAADPAPAAGAPTRLAVTFRGQPIFYVEDDGTAQAEARAARLSEALQRAIEAKVRARPDAPNVEVLIEGTDALALSVRGYPVGKLSVEDAAAARETLTTYQESLHEGLGLFVADQRRKAALQGTALKAAIAAAVMLISMLLVRLVRHLSTRADEYLDERAPSLRPLRVLGVPLVGAETLGAMAALLTSVGRIIAYVALLATGLAIALYQFELTRPWVGVMLTWGSQRVVHAAEEFLLALPRLVLAAFLLLLGSAGLRVARVLFDDTIDTQTPWGKVPVRRARVLRAVVPIAIIVLVVPLAIAAAFGRFHTPTELVIVAGMACGALGVAPVCANGAVGLLTMWRGKIRQGQDVSIRGVSGRVVGLSPWALEIERLDGATTSLPMWCLLSEPVVTLSAAPKAALRLVLHRTASIEEIMNALKSLLEGVASGVSLRCVAFDSKTLEVLASLSREADLESAMRLLGGAPKGLEVESVRSDVAPPSPSTSGSGPS